MALKGFTRNVVIIAFSAFFADMGYQVLMAGFPYFLVFLLGAPVYIYGVAEALNFGVGSLFAYFGGVLSDRYGHKRTAIIGNALIPIMSFTGFTRNAAYAISIRSAGWWMRNFRTPARRAMFAYSVDYQNRGRAFGLLHGLDVAGGVVATGVLIALLYFGVHINLIFLITIIPITVSTILLVMVRKEDFKKDERPKKSVEKIAIGHKTFLSIIVATSLFGFSYYSMGYPIITIISRTSSPILGIASYTVFMAVSAMAGFIYSTFVSKHELGLLALAGYLTAAVGSLAFVVVIHFSLPTVLLYLGVGIIAFGTGAVETFEPAIVSKISSSGGTGRAMGWLSSSRSVGMFTGNIMMGFLYSVSSEYSYLYAFIVAFASSLIVFLGSRGFDRSESSPQDSPAG